MIDLKENGVQLNVTITKTYVAVFDQGAIQYTCSIEHNGVEKTLTAFGGAYGLSRLYQPGEHLTTLYSEKYNHLKLLLNRKDSVKFNIVR